VICREAGRNWCYGKAETLGDVEMVQECVDMVAVLCVMVKEVV